MYLQSNFKVYQISKKIMENRLFDTQKQVIEIITTKTEKVTTTVETSEATHPTTITSSKSSSSSAWTLPHKFMTDATKTDKQEEYITESAIIPVEDSSDQANEYYGKFCNRKRKSKNDFAGFCIN